MCYVGGSVGECRGDSSLTCEVIAIFNPTLWGQTVRDVGIRSSDGVEELVSNVASTMVDQFINNTLVFGNLSSKQNQSATDKLTQFYALGDIVTTGGLSSTTNAAINWRDKCWNSVSPNPECTLASIGAGIAGTVAAAGLTSPWINPETVAGKPISSLLNLNQTLDELMGRAVILENGETIFLTGKLPTKENIQADLFLGKTCTGETCVVKILNPKASDVESAQALTNQFRSEMEIAKSVADSVAPKPKFVGSVRGKPGYAMSFVEGSTLRDTIQSQGFITPVQRTSILSGYDELVALTGQPHGDIITPTGINARNIMVDTEGKTIFLDQQGLSTGESIFGKKISNSDFIQTERTRLEQSLSHVVAEISNPNAPVFTWFDNETGSFMRAVRLSGNKALTETGEIIPVSRIFSSNEPVVIRQYADMVDPTKVGWYTVEYNPDWSDISTEFIPGTIEQIK